MQARLTYLSMYRLKLICFLTVEFCGAVSPEIKWDSSFFVCVSVCVSGGRPPSARESSV